MLQTSGEARPPNDASLEQIRLAVINSLQRKTTAAKTVLSPIPPPASTPSSVGPAPVPSEMPTGPANYRAGHNAGHATSSNRHIKGRPQAVKQAKDAVHDLLRLGLSFSEILRQTQTDPSFLASIFRRLGYEIHGYQMESSIAHSEATSLPYQDEGQQAVSEDVLLSSISVPGSSSVATPSLNLQSPNLRAPPLAPAATSISPLMPTRLSSSYDNRYYYNQSEIVPSSSGLIGSAQHNGTWRSGAMPWSRYPTQPESFGSNRWKHAVTIDLSEDEDEESGDDDNGDENGIPREAAIQNSYEAFIRSKQNTPEGGELRAKLEEMKRLGEMLRQMEARKKNQENSTPGIGISQEAIQDAARVVTLVLENKDQIESLAQSKDGKKSAVRLQEDDVSAHEQEVNPPGSSQLNLDAEPIADVNSESKENDAAASNGFAALEATLEKVLRQQEALSLRRQNLQGLISGVELARQEVSTLKKELEEKIKKLSHISDQQSELQNQLIATVNEEADVSDSIRQLQEQFMRAKRSRSSSRFTSDGEEVDQPVSKVRKLAHGQPNSLPDQSSVPAPSAEANGVATSASSLLHEVFSPELTAAIVEPEREKTEAAEKESRSLSIIPDTLASTQPSTASPREQNIRDMQSLATDQAVQMSRPVLSGQPRHDETLNRPSDLSHAVDSFICKREREPSPSSHSAQSEKHVEVIVLTDSEDDENIDEPEIPQEKLQELSGVVGSSSPPQHQQQRPQEEEERAELQEADSARGASGPSDLVRTFNLHDVLTTAQSGCSKGQSFQSI